jgi:rubredoxin/flavin reductase (DIM6/NTAB) family NADH-FMN oxidoreductase RutF
MNFEALNKISYGLYLITTHYEGENYGFIGNAIMQVTSDPLQIIIASNKENFSTEKITQSQKVGIVVIGEHAKREFIAQFGYKSSKNINKFEGYKIQYSPLKMPIITENMCAWYDAEVITEFDAGTHILYLCKLQNGDFIDQNEPPLTYDYYRNVFKLKSPKTAPTYFDPKLKNGSAPKNEVYVCSVCGYEYHPSLGDQEHQIAPGTSFEDLPDHWTCPLCDKEKSVFHKK